MPTYEFRAPDGTIIERVFKISDVPESIELPDGRGTAIRIISGGAGLLFKGSGFYITDYGKDGKKDQRPAGSSTESKADAAPAKSEPKSEPKSETKSATKSATTAAAPSTDS